MTKPALAFFTIVVAASIAIVYVLPFDPLLSLSTRHIVGLLCFIGVGFISEGLAIEFGPAGRARTSLAFLPFLASILVFAPIIAVIAVACVVVLSTMFFSRQSLPKALFNLSSAMVAVGLAAMTYQIFARADAALAVRSSVSYVGFALLAFVFFSTNILLMSIAIAILRGQSIVPVGREVIGPRGGNLWYDLLASPIAIVPAVLYQQQFVIGIMISLLPLLLIRYSYLSKVQLEDANRDLLKVLIKAIETRDKYTSGHSVRVATLARMVAADMELSRRNVAMVETSALLHDIGKIDSVYEAVIRKPHDLTRSERALIRTHAVRGAELLESLSSVSADIIEAVRHHHEHFDGSGYPDGRSEDVIPVAARIIMLCDAVDAMLSDRPYRKALSIEKTRMELVRCAGSQFDPSIVRVMLSKNTLERAAALIGEPSHHDETGGHRMSSAG